MRATRLAVPFAVAIGLAACGGNGKSPTSGQKYPPAVERTFLDACRRSSGGKARACNCTLGKLEGTLSYAEFRQADVAIRRGEKAPEDAQTKIADAIESCA